MVLCCCEPAIPCVGKGRNHTAREDEPPATNQQSRVWGKGGTTHGRTNHQHPTSNQPAIPCVGKGRNHTREDQPARGERKNHTREDQRASDQRPTSNQPTNQHQFINDILILRTTKISNKHVCTTCNYIVYVHPPIDDFKHFCTVCEKKSFVRW